MKTCKQCQITKELSEFPKNGDKLRAKCKICHYSNRTEAKMLQKQKDKEIRIDNIRVVIGGLK